MKKFIALIFSVVLVFSLAIPSYASTSGNKYFEDFSGNYNVSPISPWEKIGTRGVNPPTEAWNISTQGAYSFKGNAAYSRLYLSKLIWGDQYFKVNITNYASTYLTVNPMDGVPVAPYSVAPYANPDVKYFTLRTGADYFCLSFDAPSNFSGTVSRWVYQ